LKIYTKTGDDGSTGLLGNRRVAKDAPRIDAYGTIDELNAVIGLALAQNTDSDTGAVLEQVQNDLFAVGSALADPDPKGRCHNAIRPETILRLERLIDGYESELPRLERFILPGGTPAAATIHIARTVCRRAERLVVHLRQQPGESIAENVVIYLNRLSDALFVLARYMNKCSNKGDVPWRGL
jgi:cob(I)alamin adenosyltransferase